MPDAQNGWGMALGLFTEPLTAALLVFAVTGMTLYAHALQHGDVAPVTAVHWAAEVMAPSAVAIIFLGDTVRPGWGLTALVAGLCTVAAAILLATAPANRDAAHPESAPESAPQPVRPEPVPEPVPAFAAAGPSPSDSDLTGDRVIWWGPPPVWTPPSRSAPVPAPALAAPALPAPALPAPALPMPARPALPAPAMAALTWEPPLRVQPSWADPYLPDAEAMAQLRAWADAADRFPRGRTAWADAYFPDNGELEIPEPLPVRRAATHPSPPEPLPARRHPWYDI